MKYIEDYYKKQEDHDKTDELKDFAGSQSGHNLSDVKFKEDASVLKCTILGGGDTSQMGAGI